MLPYTCFSTLLEVFAIVIHLLPKPYITMLPQPQQTNSTNPRPGQSSFPRTSTNDPTGANSRADGNTPRRPRKSPAATSTATGGGMTPPPGAGKQINQIMSIAMITSPVNPLPFPLPIPLGATMLLSPGSQSSQKDGSSTTSTQANTR